MSRFFSEDSPVFRRARFFASLLAFFALLAVLVAPTPTLAVGGQYGSIRGQLVEPTTSAPVANATVTATSPSGSYKGTTDATGRFQFIQIPSDTYVLSFEKQGFEGHTLTGVTVLGDATVDLQKITISKSLRTIGSITARAPTSAFQPSQTQDTYTVSGQRITQALGNEYSTNESQLLQSVPGVIPTFDSMNGVGLSVRGSLNVELGYQFDGVPFTAPFFNENGSQGYLNNISGGSGGSLQVVSGAGDATQGNSGGGTINTVVPRGTYPGSTVLDLEVAAPFYNHTLNFNNSFASQNGRISNYFAYSGSRFVPQYAPFGANSLDQVSQGSANQNGQYYNTGYVTHDDIIDNFVFRFGKNGNQSLQALYRNNNVSAYAGLGGLNGLQYPGPTNSINQLLTELGGGGFPSTQYFSNLIAPAPFQPKGNTPVFAPDETAANPLQFLKFEYTNNLNSSTFLSATYYNWALYDGGTDYSQFPSIGFGIGSQVIGGSRTGFLADITKTVGDNQTLTLEGKYENAKPFWDLEDPFIGAAIIEGVLGVVPGSNEPQISDWYEPKNIGQPVSAANPCPNYTSPFTGQTTAGSCYLYSQLLAQGKLPANGQLPYIPNYGINYHNTDQQQWGIGFRDQYSPSSRLHLDFGVRVDGEQNRFGQDQLESSTPSDVNPDKVSNAFIRPREVEPRAALSYQLGPNDSIRMSYGRSTLFFFGQTLGTPINLASLSPLYYGIPAHDTATDPGCGSGTHGPGPGYVSVPTNYQNGANQGAPAYFYKCPNYAVALASEYDQSEDAPDLGGYGPPTYNNYDFAYSHQFSKGLLRGWAAHTTAYARTGYNVEQNVLLLNGPPNPITGQSSASIFTTTANGEERTFGLEEQITTPEIPQGRSGISGYATADFINEYTRTPPVAGSASLPILGAQLLSTGQYFRAGFVPPVTISTGFTYQMKNGIRVTPSLLANTGYAFGVGQSSLGYINGVLYTVPETNYGVNTPYAGVNGPGHAYNASYFVDPQVPGSTLNPNVVASRGYNEPAQAGNGRSPAQAYVNLNVEYPVSKNATIGLQVFNLTNNVYSVPVPNTEYQPVANGVAGPQTGKIANSVPFTSGNVVGAADESILNGANLPFLNGYGPGINFNVYARLKI
jgi:hypothetical protein